MKFRLFFIVSIIVCFAGMIWWRSLPEPRATPKVEQAKLTRSAENPTVSEASIVSQPATQGSVYAETKPRSEASRAQSKRDLSNPLVAPSLPENANTRLQKPDENLAKKYEEIERMFQNFRAITGENPVGTNAEIMKSIMGDNPKNATLGPPEGQSINEKGELLDPWGTPYFFHQLTRDVIEIRSAGPDQTLWNDDDLVNQ
jgi:hypothetical protein